MNRLDQTKMKPCSPTHLHMTMSPLRMDDEPEETESHDAAELVALERELGHDYVETVQSGCDSQCDRKTLWVRLLALLRRRPAFRTYLTIPSRADDGLESSPENGQYTDVDGMV
jgi:hypothetical protein